MMSKVDLHLPMISYLDLHQPMLSKLDLHLPMILCLCLWQMLLNLMKADLAFPILTFISLSAPRSVVIQLPK